MSVVEKLNDEIKACMKSKDEVRLSVVRMLKSKLMQVNARGEVEDDEAVAIIKRYAKQLKETITVTREKGRDTAAAEAEAELAIVQEFLPPEITEEEIKAVVARVVSETGASKPADMGKVMKAVMAELKGADGGIVKNAVMAVLK